MLSPLVDQLYAYALDKRLDGQFTDGEDEYLSCSLSADSSLDRLNKLLDETARKELAEYVRARDMVESYHRKALFSAGLSMGLALSRLG